MKKEEFVYEAVRIGIFEVDAQGRVWRIARQQTSAWGHGTKIVPCKRRRGESLGSQYKRINFMFDGVDESCFAHRLVWFHFNGAIPVGLTINHKDGDKHNNHPDNLELATHSEQTRHAVQVLGFKPWLNMLGKNSQPGEKNAGAKLTRRAALAIKKSSAKGIELAKKYGVRPSTISRVRSGVLWGHL